MRIILFTVYVVFYAFSACAFSLSPIAAKKPSLHDWSGIHSGLILGGQLGRSSDKTAAFGYNGDFEEWDYSESGLNVGAVLGYSALWQHFVFGPEIELGYLNMKGRGAQPSSPGFDTVGKSSSDFYTTFRARLGIDLDQYLLFATAGVIGVNYSEGVVDDCYIAPCGGGTLYAKKDSFAWGYTMGGGMEYLFKQSWSAKIECLYFNLNRQSFSGMTNLGNTYDWSGKSFGAIIRGGLNYHF